jgi:hypothetical protein
VGLIQPWLSAQDQPRLLIPILWILTVVATALAGFMVALLESLRNG